MARTGTTTIGSAPEPRDDLALRALSHQYASAVDHRDAEAFLEVFSEDGILQVHDPAESETPTLEFIGYEGLAEVTTRMERFDRTFHMVGSSRYAVAGDTASGEVSCIAHHLTLGDEAVNLVMFITYLDEYRRGKDGAWRITWRRLLVAWTEKRPVI